MTKQKTPSVRIAKRKGKNPRPGENQGTQLFSNLLPTQLRRQLRHVPSPRRCHPRAPKLNLDTTSDYRKNGGRQAAEAGTEEREGSSLHSTLRNRDKTSYTSHNLTASVRPCSGSRVGMNS